MFNLGNFAVKEVLYGVAQNFNDELLYTLDQLSSAEISVEADSTEITDKNGSTIRTIYTSKSASVSATSALISPALLNAASGSDVMVAGNDNAIVMPKIMVVNAGSTVDLSDIAADEKPHVMGIFANGANGDVLTPSTAASIASKTFGWDTGKKELTLPGKTETTEGGEVVGATQYLIKYQRDVKSGIALVNTADEFPDTIRLTFYAAIMDPCEDTYKAAYIYIPSFTPDPSVTISLDSGSTEMDYSGNVNVDFCSENKVLYYIFFPDENAITTGVLS